MESFEDTYIYLKIQFPFIILCTVMLRQPEFSNLMLNASMRWKIIRHHGD